jgi:hypothetical protein
MRSLDDSRIGKCFTQEIVERVAGGKNERQSCESQMLASCAWEAMIIDMDLAAANETLLETFPLRHRAPGDEVIEFLVRLDIRCLGFLDKSHSFKRVTTVECKPMAPIRLRPVDILLSGDIL